MTSYIPPPPYTIHKSVLSRLDPEYVDFFNKNLTNASHFFYTHLMPIEALRAGGNIMPGQPPLAEMAKTYDTTVKSIHTNGLNIPIRVFVPKNDIPDGGFPCIVWFHGGGWVLGNIDTENSFCTHLASRCNAIVITVDYRVAPENPFPAAIHDALDVVAHLQQNPHKYSINSHKVAVGGSSAGGNISAVISHILADPQNKEYSQLPPLVFQLLIVPVCDNTADATTHLSWKEMEHTPHLSADKMMWYRKLYLKNSEELTDPKASPIFFPVDSFRRLPPALIATAECDVLRTEGEVYSAKMNQAGVNSKLIIYPGVPHPVMAMGVPLTQARKLLDDACESLDKAFR